MTQNNSNKTINVTGFGFFKNQEIYPSRVEIDGMTYCFLDAGLRCTVRRAGRLCRIFTLTDGPRQFRLRQDGRTGVWTLLSVCS